MVPITAPPSSSGDSGLAFHDLTIPRPGRNVILPRSHNSPRLDPPVLIRSAGGLRALCNRWTASSAASSSGRPRASAASLPPVIRAAAMVGRLPGAQAQALGRRRRQGEVLRSPSIGRRLVETALTEKFLRPLAIKQQHQKKLQSLLLKEALIFGSKPSPEKTSSFNSQMSSQHPNGYGAWIHDPGTPSSSNWQCHT